MCGGVPGPVMVGDVEGSLLGVSDGLVEKDVGGWWSEMAVDEWWVVKVEVGRDGDGMAGCVALSLVQEVGAVEVSICFPPDDCMHLSPKKDLGEVGGLG